MSSQTIYNARSLASTAAPMQNQFAAQPPPQTQQPFQTGTTRPRPPHTQSAPNLSSNASNAARPAMQSSQQLTAPASDSPALIGDAERPEFPRDYIAHLPRNPNRPPPHAYQRQHEFPPFPPLTQHPILPFVTTAFSNQPESLPPPPAPAKSRPTITPRVSTTPRQVHSTVSTIPTMDVNRNDPNAIFIRPPFVVPLSRNGGTNINPSTLDGNPVDGEPAPGTPLTYAILQTHRSWFLDAADFRKDNPNKIDYPHELEPPRGWAPLSECTGAGAANRCKQAKEKNERTNAIRTKGSYTHMDSAPADVTVEYGPSDDCHEKTILRCTFCRREYHGPNAKSMWRRHVFDKHKVAMKNRREGSAGMAPKPKKGKPKAAEFSHNGPPLGLESPALALDLTNEENIIRFLERVVSGNLDITLPASLLNASSSDKAVPTLNFETIAHALQKSGISLAIEGNTLSSARLVPSFSSIGGHSTDPLHPEKTNDTPRKQGGQWQEPQGRRTASTRTTSESSLGVSDSEETLSPHTGPSPVVSDVANADLATGSTPAFSKTSLAFQTVSVSSSSSLKRKAEEGSEVPQAGWAFNRVPLKDNTAIDRNNHNSGSNPVPSTPRKDKSNQMALPSTPDYAGKLSQDCSNSSPSPRNPWTPLRHHSMTALRSRALATTGEESYLTLVVSSPATTSPMRGAGRVSFTSPLHRRTSSKKDGGRNCPPTSDDVLGALNPSSPRYPFEFNVQGMHSSPSYQSAFEPIPLESGLGPAHWTPPSLGPPAPVSRSTSRSISGTSSVGDDIEANEQSEASDREDRNMGLRYPEWSPRLERVQYRRSLETSTSKACDEDFDMEAFLDLEDAEPSSDHDVTISPHKTVVGRGLQFSKEFGLLSPEEVQHITANARSTFEQEPRSSKRQRVVL